MKTEAQMTKELAIKIANIIASYVAQHATTELPDVLMPEHERTFSQIIERELSTDATGKVLLTKGEWEEAQEDRANLDWLSDQITAQATIGGWKFQKGIGDKPQFINNKNGGLRQAITKARAESKGTAK